MNLESLPKETYQNGSSLIFKDPKEVHSGDYLCKAINDYGTDVELVKIKVKVDSCKKISKSDQISVLFPSFKVRRGERIVFEGTQLTCKFDLRL